MLINSSLPARLSEPRPNAIALLLVANECARVTVDPDLLSLLEISVETLIGDGPLALDTLPRDDFEITAAHRIATAFAEQFIIDVSGITEADRESLAAYFPGESMRELSPRCTSSSARTGSQSWRACCSATARIGRSLFFSRLPQQLLTSTETFARRSRITKMPWFAEAILTR